MKNNADATYTCDIATVGSYILYLYYILLNPCVLLCIQIISVTSIVNSVQATLRHTEGFT